MGWAAGLTVQQTLYHEYSSARGGVKRARCGPA